MTTAIFLPTRSSVVLIGESFLTMNSACPFDPRSASLSGRKGNAAVGGKKERCPGYAAGVEIAADDAGDRVRAHNAWRYVEAFGLEKPLLQGQVDDAVIRDRKDAEGDVGLFDLAGLCSRVLRARHAGQAQ